VKQILLTGGAGFIGSHLAEALLARGHRVVVIDDESTGSYRNLHVIRNHFDFHYVKGSAVDRELVRSLLTDTDEVYHLAAAVGVRRIADDPIGSIECNIRPMQVLLEELTRCLRAGHPVRLFLASSSEVYGVNPRDRWREEDAIVLGPTTHARWSYGASKAIDEFLSFAYWKEYNLPVVVGRLFNVVGPRQTGRYGMVLPRFVGNALAGKPPVVYDDGQQVRCFCHVLDVVRAILDLMESDAAVGQTVNIGSDRPVTILELAERVVAMIDPKLDIEFESYRLAYSDDFQDVRKRVPDLTKIRNLLGFEPQYDLDNTIREVIDWIRG